MTALSLVTSLVMTAASLVKWLVMTTLVADRGRPVQRERSLALGAKNKKIRKSVKTSVLRFHYP
jgi:hypothetical protein